MKYLQRAAVSNADLAEKKKITFVRRNQPIGKYPLLKYIQAHKNKCSNNHSVYNKT